MDKAYINKLTAKLAKEHNLYDIAKTHNILIREADLGETNGYYFYCKRTKVIFLNIKLSYYHKMIVLAHEIAHALLHPSKRAYFSFKEYEANYFACDLLEKIGFWNNEELCIYESEIDKTDKGFIEMYRYYLKQAKE